MKIQLIKLQNKFILVSDEEIIYDDEPYLLIFDKFETYIHKHKGDNISNDKHFKIIAGIPELPSIDFSSDELGDDGRKRIGWVDVEKLANLHCKEQDRLGESHDFISFIKGFKSAQSLNDKMFSLEDMISAAKYGYEFRDTTSFPEHKFEDSCINNFKQHIQSLQQTSWDVKVETFKEGGFHDEPVIKSKITNNFIKILRIL